MKLHTGEKIRELRLSHHVSQERLANHLNVSFQAVSKWENGISLPDVTLFPVIADFFGVSTDELFGMDRLAAEQRIDAACEEAFCCRREDPARAEAILRDMLARYPGNEVLLNNLLYTIRDPARGDEVIELCTQLIEGAQLDDVRYDACRILAETYSERGERGLTQAALERIPEFYFTRLELEAELLDGELAHGAALRQRNLAADLLIRMIKRLEALDADDPEAAARHAETAQRVLDAVGELPHPFEDGTLADIYRKRTAE